MSKAEALTKPSAKAPEKPRRDVPQNPEPPAGPHAKAALTNEDATPGAGALPPVTAKEGDVDGGVG